MLLLIQMVLGSQGIININPLAEIYTGVLFGIIDVFLFSAICSRIKYGKVAKGG